MVKQSNTPLQGKLSQLHTQAKMAMHRLDKPAQDQGKQLVAKQLLSLLGIGALGGVGVRSLMGLRDMTHQPTLGIGPSANLPHPITIYGKPQHPKITSEEEPGVLPMQKVGFNAMQGLKDVGNTVIGGAQQAGNAVADFGKNIPNILAEQLPKTHTTTPLASEWGIPAGIAALGGGAYGGYKLVDWLLNKEKNMAGEADVDAAEDDYQQALAQQYRSAMMSKRASDDLGINELADIYVAKRAEIPAEKQASMSALESVFPWVGDIYSNLPGMGYDRWQALKGAGNAAIGATMLGAGKLTYDWAKGQNKQELLRKALKRRQLMRQQMSPAPMMAMSEESAPANAA